MYEARSIEQDPDFNPGSHVGEEVVDPETYAEGAASLSYGEEEQLAKLAAEDDIAAWSAIDKL